MGYFKGIIFGVTLLNLIACDDANIVQVEEELSPQDLSIDSVVFEGGARGTLQGAVYDGMTGERLGDSLEMILIVGSDHRLPDRLIADTSSILESEYAFNNIPITSDDFYSNTVKLVVHREGYHEFVSEFSYVADNLDYNSYLSRIGNIYLYPSVKEAQDISVITLCGDTPCEGATVYLKQLTSLDELTPISTTVSSPTAETDLGGGRDTRLYPTLGLYPTLNATTNADGVAEFDGEQILLGARYEIEVMPHRNAGANSERYVQATSGEFVAGVDPNSSQQSIVMTPGYEVAPVVGVGSSEELENGELRITLNRPVVLDDNGVTATVTTDSPNAILVKSTVVELSSDRLSVRFIPEFNRDLEDAETLTITYTEANSDPVSYFTLGYEEGNDSRLLFDLTFTTSFSFQKQ